MAAALSDVRRLPAGDVFDVRRLLVVGLLVSLACGGGSEGASGEAAPAADAPPAIEAVAAEGEPEAPAPAQDDRQLAPEFELQDLAGNAVTMASLRGKTVVVDFWATWCPPCIFQIPILNAVQKRHEADGVVVIGVAVDAEGLEVVKPYAEENGVEYTILIGDESLARKFGAPGFPAMAIVDPDGRIDSMHVGLIEEEELETELAKIKARRS